MLGAMSSETCSNRHTSGQTAFNDPKKSELLLHTPEGPIGALLSLEKVRSSAWDFRKDGCMAMRDFINKCTSLKKASSNN